MQICLSIGKWGSERTMRLWRRSEASSREARPYPEMKCSEERSCRRDRQGQRGAQGRRCLIGSKFSFSKSGVIEAERGRTKSDRKKGIYFLPSFPLDFPTVVRTPIDRRFFTPRMNGALLSCILAPIPFTEFLPMCFPQVVSTTPTTKRESRRRGNVGLQKLRMLNGKNTVQVCCILR